MKLWDEALPCRPNDPVDRYLRARGLRPLDEVWPTELRHHPRLAHPSGAEAPAMIAMVRSVDGTPQAIHRTWLSRDGRKATLAPHRATLGQVGTGSIRLGAIVAGHVAIVEGIEDALGAMQLGMRPAWAASSASGMERIELPLGATRVAICPDADPRGIAAARRLKLRLLHEGRDVLLRWPAHGCKDLGEEAARVG